LSFGANELWIWASCIVPVGLWCDPHTRLERLSLRMFSKSELEHLRMHWQIPLAFRRISPDRPNVSTSIASISWRLDGIDLQAASTWIRHGMTLCPEWINYCSASTLSSIRCGSSFSYCPNLRRTASYSLCNRGVTDPCFRPRVNLGKFDRCQLPELILDVEYGTYSL
jgi:hypothetical protein